WSPMAGEDMAGMEMAITPTLGDGVAFVAAWAIMMAAMMLPSAMPMIGLYAATQRSAVNATRTSVAVSAFALMYVALWALMVVPVVAGAMGLPWVLLIACVVAAEKILPRGEWIARMTGVALALLGVAVAAEPGLAALLRAWAM